MPPVNHGFPPPAPSSGSSSDGATGPGAIPDDMLKREQEYQEALEKRNKLLLDPNPVRAMEALRQVTAKALEEEKRLGLAIKDRLGLTDRAGLPGGVRGGRVVYGDGVTSPAVQPGGPIVPPPPQVPQNARQMAEQRQAMYAAPPEPPAPGPTFGQMRGQAMSTVGQVGRYVNTGMNAVDAATAPFVDRQTRFFNTVDSLDPTGAVGALRRLQLSMQQYGSGMTREEQRRKEWEIRGEPQHVTVPHVSFAAQFVPECESAMRRLQALDQPAGQVPRMPRGMPSRGTVWGEQEHREQAALLPARRASADAFRDEEAAKGREEGVKRMGADILRMIQAADAQVITFTKAADEEGNNAIARILRAKAAAKAEEAMRLMGELTKNDDDLRAARSQTALATARRRAADRQEEDVALGFVVEREQVAATQSVRTIAMGPAERVQGQAMLQLVQQMKEAGQDLSMLPREVWDAAAAAAPETTRKLMEEAGAKRIAIDRDSGAIPQEEYRDNLPTIRRRADDLRDRSSDMESREMREVLDAIAEAFKSVVGRESRLRGEFERFLQNSFVQSLYNSMK